MERKQGQRGGKRGGGGPTAWGLGCSILLVPRIVITDESPFGKPGGIKVEHPRLELAPFNSIVLILVLLPHLDFDLGWT